MIISDLNHLEVVSQETSILGGFISDYARVDYKENLDIDKDFDSKTNVKGHLATVESTADAYGYGTSTQVFTQSLTTPYSSSSAGVSISASS